MIFCLFLSVQLTSFAANMVNVYMCTIKMFVLKVYCLGIDAGHD